MKSKAKEPCPMQKYSDQSLPRGQSSTKAMALFDH